MLEKTQYPKYKQTTQTTQNQDKVVEFKVKNNNSNNKVANKS